MSRRVPESTVLAWARLLRAQSVLLERVEAELKDAGLPPLTWYDVLIEVHRMPRHEIRQYEIGAKVLLSKYNVSRLVDRLETEGHVRRVACPKDGRGSLVVLTDVGRSLLRRMWPVYAAAITRHFASRLTSDEIQQLTALLDKILMAPVGP